MRRVFVFNASFDLRKTIKSRWCRIVGGLILLTLVLSVSPQHNSVTAQAVPPNYAHSWYITNPDEPHPWGAMYQLGRVDAIRDVGLCNNGPVDSLVVLDFGQVSYDAGGSYGGYGVQHFGVGFPFISDSVVAQAAERYARGWYLYAQAHGTDTCPRLRLVLGVNNDNQCPFGGDCKPSLAGRQWGNMVDNVHTYVVNQGWHWRMSIWAGDDMEQNDPGKPDDHWDCAPRTRLFVDGFNNNNPSYARFLDYGTAWIYDPPPPPAPPCWVIGDVYYVAWDANYNWPLPEIYTSFATESWIDVRLLYPEMFFHGVMTQCDQNDPITGDTCADPELGFTPARGWSDLWNNLNANWPGQNLLYDYATNIRSQEELP